MRHLLCEKCASAKVDGERQVLTASPIGEPAEYERVAWGVAKEPLAKNRIITVNGEPIQLAAEQYECDLCYASIRPGERCCAWSVWAEGQQPIPAWEHEYLQGDGI